MKTESGEKSGILAKFMARIPSLTRRRVRKKLEIAVYVKEILDKKGWTQRDLAKKLGKGESEISRLLSGNHNMTLDTIVKIEEILDTVIIQVPKLAETSELKIPIVDQSRSASTYSMPKSGWCWGVPDPTSQLQKKGIPISYPRA